MGSPKAAVPRLRGRQPPSTLVLLLLFIILSWLYVHLRHQQHAAAHIATLEEQQQQLGGGPSLGLAAGLLKESVSSGGDGAPIMGHNVGSQLTIAIAGGQLWGWGLQAGWRLGQLAGDTATPALALSNDTSVISVTAGRHSLVATAEGRVLSCGWNHSRGEGGPGSGSPMENSGQLGRGGSEQPAPVLGALQGKAVVQVATGRFHSLALTSEGAVYSWGLDDWGQLGRAGESADLKEACTHGSKCRHGAPQRVDELAGLRIVAVAAGRYSSMAADFDGRLYVWGHDGCATGRLPAQDAAWRPRRVEGSLAGHKVVAFAAGYVFWVAATSDGGVHTCATQDDGYAGALGARKPNKAGELGRGGDLLTPGQVTGALKGEHIVAVAAGRRHALAAAASGRVFSWGGSPALTGRPGQAVGEPAAVPALEGLEVRFVAAGEYSCLAATDSQVFGWGSDAYKATGTGLGGEVAAPTRVAGPLGDGKLQVLGLAAGYQHAFAVAVKAEHGSAAVDGDTDDLALQLLQQAEQGLQQQGQVAGADHASAGGAAELQAGSQDGAADGGPGPQQQHSLHELAQEGQQEQGRQAAGALGAAAASSLNASDSTAVPGPARAGDAAGGGAAAGASRSRRRLTPAQLAQAAAYLEAQAVAPNYTAAAYWSAWKPGPDFEADVRPLAPDVFDLLPPAFRSDMRNPCWGDGPDLQCLPWFHIIGVSKCGTTDLYQRLVHHPQVLGSRNKGPHFWDECPYPPRGPCGVGGQGDFRSYVGLFSRAADLMRSRREAVTGEASSNTFTSANGVFLRGPAMNRNDTSTTLPRLLREAAPYLRLVLMLRDPVDRAYSAYWYYRWWKKDQPASPQLFHNQTLADLAAWRACVVAAGRARCVRRYQPQQLIKGMYADFLPDWSAHWPPGQLLVLRYEDYVAAPRPHLEAVLRFLGVDVGATGAATWEAMLQLPTKNRNRYPPMLPETRQLLGEFYAEANERLAGAMGGDARWRWAGGRGADAAADGDPGAGTQPPRDGG